MRDTKAHPDPLDVLATEFTARQRQGDCPTIEEYVERYPELAEEIRVLLPTIATLEKVKAGQQRTPDGRVSLAGRRLERLGDFRVIREIGRGGMGIVFEAEQQSLGRRVAVKVLPRQALVDAKHLERFHREARTAAALHHNNIVPVFGVGQHDGFRYYVMQLIEGVGLDRVLARLQDGGAGTSGDDLSRVVGELLEEQEGPSAASPAPSENAARRQPTPRDETRQPTMTVRSQVTEAGSTPQNAAPRSVPAASTEATTPGVSRWQSVARLGIQIADALDYAHARGTLHRDIKPANLIVDHQGVVWVADFGLARALEDSAVSHSGDLVGTLAYMAPEQLQGQADHRSDIYSLGLTLYELLTLRLAFQETDRRQLLHQIAHEEPPRPRQIQPEIPRDLETIVLKTIAHEPERRYQSAADLAADLQRFLEDRPIRARRTPAPERLWRWCRRNPLVAGLSMAAAILLVLVAVTTSIGYARTTRALAGERIQRKRAEAATDVAIEVLDRIYERFAPPDFEAMTGLASQGTDGHAAAKPVLSEGAATVLEDLLVFYDRLAESGEKDSQHREKVALANRRVGDIRHHLCQFERAEAAYERAVDIYRQLNEASSDGAYIVDIASVYNELGIMAHRLGQPEQARQRLQHALDTLQKAADPDSDPELRFQMTRSRQILACIDNPMSLPPGPPATPGFGGPPPGPSAEEFGPPAPRHPEFHTPPPRPRKPRPKSSFPNEPGG